MIMTSQIGMHDDDFQKYGTHDIFSKIRDVSSILLYNFFYQYIYNIHKIIKFANRQCK